MDDKNDRDSDRDDVSSEDSLPTVADARGPPLFVTGSTGFLDLNPAGPLQFSPRAPTPTSGSSSPSAPDSPVRKKFFDIFPLSPQYEVVKKAELREDTGRTSLPAGFLKPGEVVNALEGRLSEDGEVRIRTTRGWTSPLSEDGRRVLLRPKPTRSAIEPMVVPSVTRSAMVSMEQRLVARLETWSALR